MNTQAFRDGHFEVQDRSSQALCMALPVTASTTVMDLCAGAGGKSLALAARVSLGSVRPMCAQRRSMSLKKRARRAGASIAIEQPSPADLVLVDAPCSGSGRLRRNPAIRWGLTDQAHRRTQAELLVAATDFVGPGGILVYATCSLLSRENDHPTPAGFTITESRTLWPHTDNSDGFYWRVMTRD